MECFNEPLFDYVTDDVCRMAVFNRRYTIFNEENVRMTLKYLSKITGLGLDCLKRGACELLEKKLVTIEGDEVLISREGINLLDLSRIFVGFNYMIDDVNRLVVFNRLYTANFDKLESMSVEYVDEKIGIGTDEIIRVISGFIEYGLMSYDGTNLRKTNLGTKLQEYMQQGLIKENC